jgi:hypothetical protein
MVSSRSIFSQAGHDAKEEASKGQQLLDGSFHGRAALPAKDQVRGELDASMRDMRMSMPPERTTTANDADRARSFYIFISTCSDYLHLGQS